ncbi:MAG: B12-binding domain-containing radical SAM protein [Candidatus Thermoplasmatota archaeon]|nr:B12-binding domain-containing radical SAM protein [Candidatus Thermoplasmatota archaeon]MBU1941966.1 B12-binding domain-containing radical SAM protein [Candidatus Thermoplasmatota archaeon]
MTQGLRYTGPIYRPPSEAHSLLVQATIGCPWNKCTFCMIYKKGPPFRIRPVKDIKEDLLWAYNHYGPDIQTIFFPSGNTIIMKTQDFVDILHYTKHLFPHLQRITIYGSAQYIAQKTVDDLKKLADAGLSRIHVGLESGSDTILAHVKKGSTAALQTTAGCHIKQAGIELSEYILLGLGGKQYSTKHIKETTKVLNNINPDFIRIRTLLPKINTPFLEEIQKGTFTLLSPHEILQETYTLIKELQVTSYIISDHYTNYIQVQGTLPQDRETMLSTMRTALKNDETSFRKPYIGTE